MSHMSLHCTYWVFIPQGHCEPHLLFHTTKPRLSRPSWVGLSGFVLVLLGSLDILRGPHSQSVTLQCPKGKTPGDCRKKEFHTFVHLPREGFHVLCMCVAVVLLNFSFLLQHASKAMGCKVGHDCCQVCVPGQVSFFSHLGQLHGQTPTCGIVNTHRVVK